MVYRQLSLRYPYHRNECSSLAATRRDLRAKLQLKGTCPARRNIENGYLDIEESGNARMGTGYGAMRESERGIWAIGERENSERGIFKSGNL